MKKTKEKKDTKNKEEKIQKKNLNTKITLSKLVSIFILFLVILIIFAYTRTQIINYNLIVDIINTTNQKLNSDNLYLESYSYSNINTLSEYNKIWAKGDYIKQEHFWDNVEITYKNRKDNTAIYPDQKTIMIHEKVGTTANLDLPFLIYLEPDQLTFFDKIKLMTEEVDIIISSMYGKPCYRVTYITGNVVDTTWFDVQTLLPIKTSSGIDTTYYFSECTLTEDELTIDSTGYNVIDLTNTQSKTTN